jgi:uncharacterized protein (TIGR02996 family)
MSAPLSREDRAFIRSILDYPEDFTVWLAYADWLDERGDPRAEFLRLMVDHRRAPAGSAEAARTGERLLELRQTLDPRWLMVFDTVDVANCPASNGWAFRCPKTWDSLAPTDEPDIRICHDCKSPVFYCHTVEEARQFASAGQCIALSSRSEERYEPMREMVRLGRMHVDDEYEEYEPPVLPPTEPVPPPRPWWKFW